MLSAGFKWQPLDEELTPGKEYLQIQFPDYPGELDELRLERCKEPVHKIAVEL